MIADFSHHSLSCCDCTCGNTLTIPRCPRPIPGRLLQPAGGGGSTSAPSYHSETNAAPQPLFKFAATSWLSACLPRLRLAGRVFPSSLRQLTSTLTIAELNVSRVLVCAFKTTGANVLRSFAISYQCRSANLNRLSDSHISNWTATIIFLVRIPSFPLTLLPPISHQRAFVCGPCKGISLVGILLVASLDLLFKRLCLCFLTACLT